MIAMIAILMTILLFVPWFLIVLIPLGVLLFGGSYCIICGGNCQESTKHCEFFALLGQEKSSAGFKPMNDYISV